MLTSLRNDTTMRKIKLTLPRLNLLFVLNKIDANNAHFEIVYNSKQWIEKDTVTVIAYVAQDKCLQTFMESMPDYVTKEQI